MAGDATSHIMQSLVVNITIAICKGVAAVFTGSGAMLAETLHSTADCGNQLLLLLGVKHSRRVPDSLHPLGYGRSLYFWSFMVALLLFSGGGVFSIYEGIHKFNTPEPVEKVWLGLAILGFSLILEGYATISNIREANQRRGSKPFFRYLRETKDSDFVVVMGENTAASFGLVFAMIALFIAHLTGDSRWDAVGSLVIGVILVGVAIFLAREVKSLLVGEAADPEIEAAARDLVTTLPEFDTVLAIITMQQGPGEVLVAMKLKLTPNLSADAAIAAINRFEVALKQRRPEVRWSFVEPDNKE